MSVREKERHDVVVEKMEMTKEMKKLWLLDFYFYFLLSILIRIFHKGEKVKKNCNKK